MPFSPGTVIEQAEGLASLLPNDRVFFSKNYTGTKLQKLILGLAYEIWRVENKVEDISIQYNIFDTVNLIDEWERAMGIPDDCFTNTGTIEQRRINIIAKLRARGVATKEAFIALAAFMGYTIEIFTLSELAYPPYNVPFFPVSLPQGRFVWLIKGYGIAPFTPPYDVPFTPMIGSDVIPCFFNKLKPANTILLFENLELL